MIDVNNYLSSPLMYAASSGVVKIAKVLIGLGADVSDTNDQKMSALHFAVECGSVEMVEYLLSIGADIEAESTMSSQTALLMATSNGFLDVVKLLVGKGPRYQMYLIEIIACPSDGLLTILTLKFSNSSWD